MKKLVITITGLFISIHILFAKTTLDYIQSRSHFDLTVSHSFHTNLKITNVSGPLKLRSNLMPSFGFAVRYNYYFHQNIYGIIGFAFENIPTQVNWDFGTYKNYFPEKFRNYGYEKQQINTHYFLNRSFPIGIGTSLILKQKQHIFIELILNNVINGDRRDGVHYSYINLGRETTYFAYEIVNLGRYKYSPEFGFNIGYAHKLRSGDFFKISILTNFCLTPILEGEYNFINLGKGNDSYGLINYKNNFWAIQISYTLNYNRIKRVKSINPNQI